MMMPSERFWLNKGAINYILGGAKRSRSLHLRVKRPFNEFFNWEFLLLLFSRALASHWALMLHSEHSSSRPPRHHCLWLHCTRLKKKALCGMTNWSRESITNSHAMLSWWEEEAEVFFSAALIAVSLSLMEEKNIARDLDYWYRRRRHKNSRHRCSLASGSNANKSKTN